MSTANGRGPAAAGPPVTAAADDPSLRTERERLAAEVARLQWDLGGLAYEMAIRDHFRLDVLVRVAARIQERDAALGAVERALHLREGGAAGACGACGAMYSRGAAFCWSCGAELMGRVEPAP